MRNRDAKTHQQVVKRAGDEKMQRNMRCSGACLRIVYLGFRTCQALCQAIGALIPNYAAECAISMPAREIPPDMLAAQLMKVIRNA